MSLAPAQTRRLRAAVALALGVLAVSACTSPGAGAPMAERGLRPSSSPLLRPPATAAPTPEAADQTRAAPVRPLGERIVPDVLVTGALPADVRERLIALSATGAGVGFRAGRTTVGGRPLDTVAVDASAFRRFTAPGTAEADAVWQAVARGEAVVSHEVAEASGLRLGEDVVVRGPGGEQRLRLGALATTGVPRSELVVADAVGQRLGLTAGSGLLLAGADGQDTEALAEDVREVTGAEVAVDLLTAPAADPVASLTGGAAAEDLGAFSYRYYSDGTIEPDAAWVSANIRTETVPVLGRVTCHRLMLPQLRGALQEVADAGLASSLSTYDGCYVPRFIERDPSRSISLHTWGIAIDMDAATNYRGIRGTMNPRVVEIFKRWGFRWGGDWAYTDPMHFELGTLRTSPRR